MIAALTVSTAHARCLLMHGAGLLENPDRRATVAEVLRTITRMGFVQVDTILAVERAHHHILHTRLHRYRPDSLRRLLEVDRTLFEHWTHDASIIPACWIDHWSHRFERSRLKQRANAWWRERMGPQIDQIIAHVLERITREGPLMSRDFEHARPPGQSAAWWAWKPQKSALEHLWRTGVLAVARRENFQKVYDLAERVYPQCHWKANGHAGAIDADAHLDWACRTALERVGVATSGELAAFWHAVSPADARRWCADRQKAGELISVTVPSQDDERPRGAFAFHDIAARIRSVMRRPLPEGIRLINPFDPLVRDRRRAFRLFGFDYRFEAFVPGPRRTHGYYVMPLLEGDRFVGRIDPKFHRDTGVLHIRRVWWEPQVKPTRRRTADLDAALARFAAFIGADNVRMPSRKRQTAGRVGSPPG